MVKKINKKELITIIGVTLLFVGLCIFCSTYFLTKKNEVFDDMNELYYEQIVALDEETNEIDEEEPTTSNPDDPEPTTVPIIDYDKYYVGYLNIPKINLKRGFTDIDSKYNNVNRNIFVHPTSTFPNKKNSNLILASHSGTSSISYFKNLYKLEIGDTVYINYDNKEYRYEIKNIYTEKKDGDVRVRRNKNTSTLTLITCTKGDNTTQTLYICELVSE